MLCNTDVQSWRNPEDAFYWDPVFVVMRRHYDTSSLMLSVTSPQALTPPLSESAGDPVLPTDADLLGDQVQTLCCSLWLNIILLLPIFAVTVVSILFVFFVIFLICRCLSKSFRARRLRGGVSGTYSHGAPDPKCVLCPPPSGGASPENSPGPGKVLKMFARS